MDLLVYYANRLLNQVEKNYTPTKKEALTMVYKVKKFKHYLLTNHFIFFIDHQALVYMVNRPIISNHIACWLLIMLEFNFEVIYKLGSEHVVLDYLSRLKRGGNASKVTIEESRPYIPYMKIGLVLYNITWRHELSLTILIGINRED